MSDWKMEEEVKHKQDAEKGESSRVKTGNKQEARQVQPSKQTLPALSKSRITQLQEQHFIVSTKEGSRFYCRVCNMTLDSLNEEKVKQHISGKGHRKNVKTKGTLITMKSISNPVANQIKALETMLDSIIKEHALNPDIDLKIRQQIPRDLTSLLQARIPDCKVDVFGSSLSCFGFKSSDVNLDLTLPNDKLTVPEALISIKELLSTSDQCSSVKDEFDLSIPHIFFIDKKSGLACRLCCGCKLACKTSLLLKHYGSLHPTVWPLVVGFRYWAKICSVDSKDGGLPAYCLALMVIQFLQNTSPPILPLLDTEQELDGKTFHSKNTSTLGQLWFQLFRYYSIVFQVDEDIISIRVKQPYNREERKWGHRRFAIEDPYITNHNVSTVTSDRVFEYITHCLNRSFIYYGTIPKYTNKGVISKTRQSSSLDDDDEEIYEEHGLGSESDLSCNKQDDEAIFQMDDVVDSLSNDMNYLTLTSKDPALVYHMKQDILTDGKQPEVQCQCCKRDGHITTKCPELKKPSLKPLPKLSGKVLDIVTRLCAQTRDARLHLFGSSMNGFGFKDSDLDICMTLDGKKKDDVDSISVIKDLAKKLKQHRDCGNVVAITTAKVPIVKFCLRSVRKEADISFYNVLALENTKMLAMYAKIDDRVSVLGYTLKLFAKLCDIGDASKGSLSSYAYILMLLHYLQQCNVIPVLQELYHGNKPTKIIDSWNCWFFDDLSSLHEVWKSNNRDNVGTLWIGFLRYYTEVFDWEHDVICCRRTKTLTKFEKMWTRHIFAIEDPFNLDHNLGAGISRKMGTFIKTALIRGRERFGSQPHIQPGMHLMEYYFNADYFTDGFDAPNDRTCRVCGHIGHIARECPRLKKNRKDERMDNEERSKLSYRPFAAPNFTPRKRAATAPVNNKQNTVNTVVLESLPNAGDTPLIGSLPSTVDTPIHVGSLPTNIQQTNIKVQPLVMSPPRTAWRSTTSTRQRSSSESMADSPPVMPLASPPNVYRTDVPIYLHHISSPLHIGSQIPMTSQHATGSPNYVTKQAVGSPHHVGSPQHIGSPHVGSQHNIGSPPSHLMGSPHVKVAHHIAALHQSSPSHPTQQPLGSPVQKFIMVSPPNYQLPLSQQPQQQQPQQQQPHYHYSTNQTKQDTADKHMTPDEFFSLVREAESKEEGTKPPELSPHRTITNAVLGHSKKLLSSPKTEDEHKLFSNLDKVRSLWSGNDTSSIFALDIDSAATNKKYGSLGDAPIVSSDRANNQSEDLHDFHVGFKPPTSEQDGPQQVSTNKHDQPAHYSEHLELHQSLKLSINEHDGLKQDESDLPTMEKRPSMKDPCKLRPLKLTEQGHDEHVKAPTKKGRHKGNKQQVKSGPSEEGTKTQLEKDLSKVGFGSQSRTDGNEKGFRNPAKKGPREGPGTPSKKDSHEGAVGKTEKRSHDEGNKTPGKKRPFEGGGQQQKNSLDEGAPTPWRKGHREEGTMTPPNKGQHEGGAWTFNEKGPLDDHTTTMPNEGPKEEGTSYRNQEENLSDNSLKSRDGPKLRQSRRTKRKPIKLSPDVSNPSPSSSLSSVGKADPLPNKANKANMKQTNGDSTTIDGHTETPKRKHKQRGRGRGKGGGHTTKKNDDGSLDPSAS